MGLEFKKRGVNDRKKILIYGEDGSGKSTFAEQYCIDHSLKPVVIDIDDTNFTNVPNLKLDLSSDLIAYRNIKKAIGDIVEDGNFDTIIVDGVTSMLEMFVSKAKGLKKYADRAERFNDILKDLLGSGMNLIFIGQVDMKVIHNDEFQSPKPIIKVNSIVNEKYITYKKKNGYSHKVVKYRVCETPAINEPEVKTSTDTAPYVAPAKADVFMTADDVDEPEQHDDPIRGTCQQIKIMLEKEGKLVTKSTMRSKAVKLIKEGVLLEDSRADLINYINKHCPEELD